MACKESIRQHIDAAKAYYQQERHPDPFRDFWTALVHRVHDASDGFYRLSHCERTYYLATVLHGEAFNGGIGQFFDNSSRDFYRETLDALEELGATRCRALLVTAKQVLFPHSEPARDQATRDQMMPEYPDGPDAPRPDWDLELERISDEFYTDPDQLPELLRRYALDHQLVRI